MPQIWTRWLQVKRIQSGTPDHNPIPATAHKTPLLEHQPNLFNSTLIRCYCRQLDFYTGEDNHMGCECPAMDSSPGKNVQFTYRLQACSESVKRAGYYRELTVPGIRPFLLYSRPIIGSFAYHPRPFASHSASPMARPFSWLGRIYRLSALEQQSSVKEVP